MKRFRLPEKLNELAYGLLRSISLKKRLALVLGVVVLLLTLALTMMLNAMISSYEAYVSMRNAQLVNAVADEVRTGISSLLAVTKYPVIQVNQRPTDTYNYLAHPDKYGTNVLYADLEYRSTFLFEQNRKIRLIAVFDVNGNGSYVKNNKKYTYQLAPSQQPLEQKELAQEQWFTDTLSVKGSPRIWRSSEMELSGVYLQDREDMLFVSRAIMSVEHFDPLGIILAAVDVSAGSALLEQSRLFPEQQIGFFNEEGELLFGTLSPASIDAFLQTVDIQSEESGAGSFRAVSDGQDELFHYAQGLNGYYCVLETPYRQVLRRVLQQKLMMFIGLTASCILVSLVINAIVRSIARPVKNLAETCNAIVNDEDFSISIQDDYHDELSELTASLNALTRRIEYLIYDVYEKKMELSHTQLQLLRSQVNPHFLYNTLETIRTKAYLNGQQDLSDMALLLANILRYGISAPEEMVTVEAEVEKLREYVALQHYLYGDKFTANISIEPEILPRKMLKFVLQPLVENALYHGINSIQTTGTVEVLGYLEGEDMIFQVIDNGSGISKDVLEDLREYMDNNNEKFNSIGLKNVHRRIRLLYGEKYGVTINSEINMGTMILVRVPALPCKMGTPPSFGLAGEHHA